MKEEQLRLFYEPTEDKLQRQIDELHSRIENARKGLFKRHQELSLLYLELRSEIDILKDQRKIKQNE